MHNRVSPHNTYNNKQQALHLSITVSTGQCIKESHLITRITTNNTHSTSQHLSNLTLVERIITEQQAKRQTTSTPSLNIYQTSRMQNGLSPNKKQNNKQQALHLSTSIKPHACSTDCHRTTGKKANDTPTVTQ